jgi:uncharacterized SAM-binding protein YcdF (DUF218 family)
MQINSIQAIVVLGAGTTSTGELSPSSAVRIAKAVELIELFQDAMLIMSGNAPIRTERAVTEDTEAAIMKKYAVSFGVDSKRILLEKESRDTLANATLTKKNYLVPRQLRNIIVVTSSFHIPRAEYLFRKVLGPDYIITFVSAGGEVRTERLIKEERSLAFAKALLDTATDGDDDEIWRRIGEWLHPYAKHPRFTLDEWYAYTNDGKPLPAFPDSHKYKQKVRG